MNATQHRVIVKKLSNNTETVTGIILQTSDEQPRARVVSKGPKVTADISVDDIVVVDWSRVGRFEYLEQEYFILNESNILAVVSE